MLPDSYLSYEKQMAEDWAHASARNKNQIRRIIASFSRDELDPDDEMSVITAGDIAIQFCEQYYPGHKTAIFIQKDGVGGLIHIHMDVCNVNSITWKGCNDDQCRASWVAENFDKVAQEYIQLSTGIGMPSKENKAEFVDTGITEKKSTNPYVRKRRDDGKYVWRDDLTERIEHVVDNEFFTSRDEFIKTLAKYGVGAEYHETKKGRKYYTYELLDTDGFTQSGASIPKNGTKAKSYKLSEFCDVDFVDQRIEFSIEHYKMMQEHPELFTMDDDEETDDRQDVDVVGLVERDLNRKYVIEEYYHPRDKEHDGDDDDDIRLPKHSRTVDDEDDNKAEADETKSDEAKEDPIVIPHVVPNLKTNEDEDEDEYSNEASNFVSKLEPKSDIEEIVVEVESSENPFVAPSNNRQPVKRPVTDDERERRRIQEQHKEDLRIKLKARYGESSVNKQPDTAKSVTDLKAEAEKLRQRNADRLSALHDTERDKLARKLEERLAEKAFERQPYEDDDEVLFE